MGTKHEHNCREISTAWFSTGLRSVNELMRQRACLRVQCAGCKHNGIIPTQLLRKKLGDNGDITRPRYACSQCGNANVALTMVSAPTSDAKASQWSLFWNGMEMQG